MYDLLRLMVNEEGLDLFSHRGFPPAIKIDAR